MSGAKAAPGGALITETAPAKVNLSLHVVGKRADGYHLLDSLVAFADVCDVLTFRPADDLSLSLDGPMAARLDAEVANSRDNIILRAAVALADWAGIAPRAAIALTKVLPVAAGIGGGSADAAAALRGLCRLWTLSPGPDDLARIGLTLGADVPVCLRGRATAMAGVGERLDPAPVLPPAWLVLVNPLVALSTPAVFKARRPDFSPAHPLTAAPADARALAAALAERRNDLTDAARSLAPVVGAMLDAIAATDACLLARMSGSGATCFGLYANETEARAAAATLSAAHPGWWIAPARLIG